MRIFYFMTGKGFLSKVLRPKSIKKIETDRFHKIKM